MTEVLDKNIEEYPTHEEILDQKFLDKYKNKQPNWGFNNLGYIVFKRTYARIKDDGSTEEWWETVERCVRGAQKIGACYTKKEAQKLYDLVFNLKCNFGGRMLWQLGTSTVEKFGLPSLCNCWYINIDQPESFCFLFEHLMLGGGVGFSVKREHVHELPKIKDNVLIIHKNTNDADFIVPDSREGWVELLRRVLNSFFVTGKGFSFSTILVRGAGTKIKGFGGTASGPQILIDGIQKVCQIFNNRIGKKLRSIDALDICNILGSVVVAGNVRRSAQVAIGDADDKLFINAKRWDLGNIPNWRAMSNNTIFADTYNYLSNDFWNGYEGNGEAYGLFNLDLCKKYGRLIDGPISKSNIYPAKIDKVEGANPCQPKWATVLTEDGIKKLEDISIGDKIWSSEGWTTIVNKWSNGIKKVFKYKTNSSTFFGTENHRIISESEKIEIKDADSIDSLVGPCPKNIQINSQDIIDGIVFGDGTVHKASNNLVLLCIGEDDKDYFDSEIKEYIKKYRPGIGEYEYEISTEIIAEELPKTYNRKIPDRYFYGSTSKVLGFLRGLYSANGSICGKRVTLKTSSKDVRDQVQIMLSSVGIKSYFTTNLSKEVEFSNGKYICKESYDINISSDRDIFYQNIGFIQKYKNSILLDIIKNTKSQNGKVTYDISSTEFISEEEVFDITVDNLSHTYWTGGCNVSNCLEANLEHGEPCDLAEIYLSNVESEEELHDCAILLYKTQKAILTLPSLSEWTNDVVKRNMRIGLGITGICEDLRKLDWLDKCYLKLRDFDKKWSKLRNWPESIKLTVVKPSGTLSLLAGCTPGGHPAYDRYFIRRIRMSSEDPLVKRCRDLGFKVEYQLGFDGLEQRDTVVVEFPCKSSDTAILAKNYSAIDQLELVKKLQTYWADQSVSVTIYYSKEELPSIKEWLKENYENSVKAVSFLMHSDHGFIQPPYDPITEEKYFETIKNVKDINSLFETDFNGFELENTECSNGSCPIK